MVRNCIELLIENKDVLLPVWNLLEFKSTPMILDAPAILAPSAA